VCAPHSSRPTDRCKVRFDPSTGISSDAPTTTRFTRRTRRRTQTHTLPFAALPHDLRKDPRLRGKDKAILLAAALLEYACNKPSCYPSNARLAADLNCCYRSVQYALAQLRDAGWIAVEQGSGGRVIHLLWFEDPPCNGLHTPHATDCVPKKKKEEEERNVTNLSPSERTAPPLRRPQELPPATLTASRPHQPAQPLQDTLKAVPGASQDQVRQSAWRLAHHLQDVASIGFFIMVLGLVATSLAPVERLLAAFVVADRARGKARKPGAIFASAWSGWVPPPKPSDINRPMYHRAPATVPHPEPPPPEPGPNPESPPPEPGPREPITAEMLRNWETWVAQPRHPLAGYARKMLAAHHAGELPPEGGGELSAPQAGLVATRVEPVAVPVVDQAERDRAQAALAYWEGLTAEERKWLDAEALAHADPAARADYEAELVPVLRRMKMSAIRNAYLDAMTVAR
jgi:Helix-turn-helix domain